MRKLDLSKIEPPKLREFYEKGIALIESSEQAFSIKPGQPEFDAWVRYFDRVIGKRPATLQWAIDRVGSGEFTVPTQWPEWFDSSAAA